MIDYTAVLADLASKRAAACALFDGVSEGLRLLIAASPAPAEVAPPRQLKAAPGPKAKPHRAAAKVHRPAATPKAAESASRPESPLAWKAIAERDGLRAACTASGIPYATLWARAKAQGWKVARRQVQHAKAKPASKPKGDLVPSYRCESCQLTTQRDPCEFCGTRKRA